MIPLSFSLAVFAVANWVLAREIRRQRREVRRLRSLLAEANEAFDECTSDYAKMLCFGDSWRVVR